jgi:hypothetical protein
VLASHPSIATTAEPWLLLPFCYALEDDDIFTDYEHSRFRTAFRAFLEKLPEKEQDFYSALRSFALDLYQQFTDADSKYFLDKTPRYHLIAQHIMRAFPDGKFIFLWRNPLSVASSMIQSWGEGRWNLYRYKVDLYKGLKNLVTAYSERPNEAAAYDLRFEDLVADPRSEVKALFAFLEVPFEQSVLEAFVGIGFKGEMGDQKGVQRYKSISQAPVEKWKSVLNNPLRKAWTRRYLKWIGEDQLRTMGYDLFRLIERCDGIPISYQNLFSDSYHMSKGKMRPWVESVINKEKISNMSDKKIMVSHA